MLPPVFPYICAGVIKLFGDSLITLRLYGLFERIILFIPIYLMLRRLVSVETAFFAVITSTIYYTSTNADSVNTFYQTTILIGIFSLYFLLKSFDCSLESKSPKSIIYTILSGVFCSLSVLTIRFFYFCCNNIYIISKSNY